MKREEIDANTMNYMIASMDDKEIFLHEAVWVLNSRKPIPDGYMICHKDGNTMNNDFDNLGLVEENRDYGDLHKSSNRIFQESSYRENSEFIKKHFDDVYDVLFKK